MNKSLSQEVYDQLLSRLLSNQLMPGEIMNRRQIAGELNVSVAPVLEAMLQLEAQGFLETLPRKGTRVKLLRKEDIVGQLILREALECQAARMYCGKAVSENLDALMPLAEAVDKAREENLEDWQTEILFHRRLVVLAGCPALTKEFERVMKLYVFYGMNKLIPSTEKTKRDNHVRLLQDLTVMDPLTGDAVMRKHLMVGKGYLFKE